MANNNEVPADVPNVARNVPVVVSTTIGREVHTSRSGVVAANAAGL